MKTKTFDIGETQKAKLILVEKYKDCDILVLLGDDK